MIFSGSSSISNADQMAFWALFALITTYINCHWRIKKSHNDLFAELLLTLKPLKCFCVFGVHL